MSDDGAWTLVVIALVGSPFSPAYARDRASSPLRFSAMNVALRGARGGAWSLTERAISEGDRAPDGIAIGPSVMRWEGGALVITIEERTAPGGAPVRGRVRLWPECAAGNGHALDAGGRHGWWPIAPLATAEVELDEPAVRFRGHAYHDANAGAEPLEAAFARWSWARARVGDRAVIVYDTTPREGPRREVALAIDARGDASPVALAGPHALGTTPWLLGRSMRADARPRVARTLESGPFYARTLVRATLLGEEVLAMHEELSCDRLATDVVRFMLGYRMRAA